MDYIIGNKNVAVKVVEGRTVTCSRKDAQRFEYGKAKNVLGNLPKTLKKFHFKIEAIPEIKQKSVINILKKDDPPPELPKVTTNESYILPEQVNRWVDKVKSYNGLVQEASDRKETLLVELSNIDKQISDLEHEIEFVNKPNACMGYKMFRQLKDALIERRTIKDEIIVVGAILNSKVGSLTGEYMDKTVEGLQHRKYKYRQREGKI